MKLLYRLAAWISDLRLAIGLLLVNLGLGLFARQLGPREVRGAAGAQRAQRIELRAVGTDDDACAVQPGDVVGRAVAAPLHDELADLGIAGGLDAGTAGARGRQPGCQASFHGGLLGGP